MEYSNVLHQIYAVTQRNPEKRAIEYGTVHLTYAQLTAGAKRIAGFLSQHGTASKNVMIFMGKGPVLIQSIMGVIHNGGIFIPLDPHFPVNRLHNMIDFIQSDWIITRSDLLPKLNTILTQVGKRKHVLLIDEVPPTETYSHLDMFHLEQTEKTTLPELQESKNCYIYFTSGSTGKPKGIVGRSRSLAHFIQWEIKEFGVDATFKVSQFTSPSFDVFLRDIFVPLCAGGTLCIPETDEIILNPRKMLEWLEERQIMLAHMVPSLFKVLVGEVEETAGDLPDLRYILMAGEMLRGNDLKRFYQIFADRIQLVNLYGPTETTLAKFFYRVKAEDQNRVHIPVGKPIDSTELLLLDLDGQFCRVGTVGEVYIRTPFISSGYYNDLEMTKKVFLRNPFSTNPNDLIYKTGDLGKVLPDGNLELIGRADHQVKIRGFRVELREIENELLNLPDVKDAVVALKEDEQDNKYLCAYVVSDQGPNMATWREHLAQQLPDYMVPSYMMHLERLPLNPNGKVDLKALPEPDKRVRWSAEYVAPTDQIELTLVEIWSEILGTDTIGICDNFFDLGGHSLKVTVMISKIFKELEVELPLREVFEHPTIQEIAQYIRSAGKSIYASIQPLEEREYYTLSSAQKRLYIIHQMNPQDLSYNILEAMVIEGPIDYQRFEDTFKALIQRHESFRTYFSMVNGEPVQMVCPEVEFALEVIEVPGVEVETRIKEFVKPFDLRQAPLLRVCLFRCEDKHILVYDMHHIISDGTSKKILMTDFIHLYYKHPLPDLRVQYKDFAEWQNQFLESEALQKEAGFWLDQFQGELPILNLPTDFPRPLTRSSAGNSISFELPNDLVEKIHQLIRQKGVTLYMVLLSAYNILLSRYAGQEDIVVGTPIAGRPHDDLEKIIGFFVNTLAMRNYPGGEKTYLEFLAEIKEQSLRAFENQDYPFDMLVDKLAVHRERNRSPLFDVMLALQNTQEVKVDTPDLRFDFFDTGNKDQAVKFDLALMAYEPKGKIQFRFRYSTRLFQRETIEQMARHFTNILREVTDHPTTPLGAIQMLSPDEKATLLGQMEQEAMSVPKQGSLIRCFEEQARRTPTALAVSSQGRDWSYAEVEQRVNRLTQKLSAWGVQSGTPVGMVFSPSPALVWSVLAVLKAGGIYVPIPTGVANEEIAVIVADCQSPICLTNQESTRSRERNFEVYTIFDDTLDQDIAALADCHDREWPNPQSGDPACIAYHREADAHWSGTPVTHASLLRYIHWVQVTYFAEGEAVALYTPFTYEMTAMPLFTPLISGGRVVIYSENALPEAVMKIAQDDQVDILQLTPTLLQQIAQSHLAHTRIRKWVLWGEECRAAVAKTICETFGQGTRVINHYGQAEVTLAALSNIYTGCAETHGSLPLGHPTSGHLVYILDAYGNPTPVGVPGDLYIQLDEMSGADGNRPDQTETMDVAMLHDSGHRLCKTGDRAKWLDNGQIAFCGKASEQVTIRGFAIPIREIEESLFAYSPIRQAAVCTRQDEKGQLSLIGYLVVDDSFDEADLRKYLARKLPGYMIPSQWVSLPALPLTVDGRVDRGALSAMAEWQESSEEVKPHSKLEGQLITIWREVLCLDPETPVKVNDNFYDMGGNSLLVVLLRDRLNEIFPHPIEIMDLFAYPTIAKLAEFMELKSQEKCQIGIQPITLPADYFQWGEGDRVAPMLRFELKENVTSLIRQVVVREKVDVRDFLLGAYMNLLAQLSGEQELQIHALVDNTDEVAALSMDFAKVTDLSSLLHEIHEQRISTQLSNRYKLSQYETMHETPKPRSVVPLVYTKLAYATPQEQLAHYDLILQMKEGEQQLSFVLEGSNQLNTTKVKELANAYVKLIKIFVQQFDL